MDHLFRVPLFSVQAVGAAATLLSSAIDNRFIDRWEALQLQVTSVVGNADVRVEYAISDDAGVTFQSADNDADILTSSNTDLTNFEEAHMIPMPAILANHFRIEVDEISAGALTDTLVTVILIAREVIR